MNGQAGKGPELRKGANLKNFREGYDTIDWGASHKKREALSIAKLRRSDRMAMKRKLEEIHADALRQATEIRKRLTETYSHREPNYEIFIDV